MVSKYEQKEVGWNQGASVVLLKPECPLALDFPMAWRTVISSGGPQLPLPNQRSGRWVEASGKNTWSVFGCIPAHMWGLIKEVLQAGFIF